MAVQKEIDYRIDYGDPEVTNGLSVFSEEFDQAYFYEGDDLGCSYTPDESSFVLWAPTASEAFLVLYPDWRSSAEAELPMVRGDKGVWRAQLAGNFEGKLYTYKVRIGKRWNEAADPYSQAVGVNGDRTAIIDMSKTNPDRWTTDKPAFTHGVDAIIYEAHIRDLTIHPMSGAIHKGKYLGACESGTTGPDGIPTGLDHIVRLGVTHLELLPINDFATESVDETKPDLRYNWGYDPKNYNVPEGSYATDPYDPKVRIRELKTLIQTCHDRGLRVIMDVVYNHVYDGFRIHFNQLVPGYYFRYKKDGSFSDGSGCGNDTASERRMMHKYILESVLYWVKEYHIDGFRFDLMGLMDVDTVNEIRRQLELIDPSILMIGEGWVMETELELEQRANQRNASRIPEIGLFNDGLRDGLKGDLFGKHVPGFSGGKHGKEHDVKKGIAAAIPYSEYMHGFALEPVQSVAYAESHDNHTLWDKLVLSNSLDDEWTLQRRHMLATSVVMTSQGIAFIHAGQEFMRTKYGVENSYKSPDHINWMDWERCAKHTEGVQHMHKLIMLRRKHPAFRLRTADQVRRHLFFEEAPAGSIVYTLRDFANGDSARHLFIAHNANDYPITVKIPLPGIWTVVFGLEQSSLFDRKKGGDVEIAPLSSLILGSFTELDFYPV